MIDINRIVEFAINKGYFISDLYNAIGIQKAGFLNIRKNKSGQFRIDYFYDLCEYLGIDPRDGLEIFDSKSEVNLKKYEPEYDINVLNDRNLKIEEIIKYAHSKGIYIKDIVEYIGIEGTAFREFRKSRNEEELKKYFFDICKYVGIPYGKAVTKYTVNKSNKK
ncbi:helix-turn-helix transcriptional regulator [Clostridium sp. VAP23]|uniref:helix-turn-helix domain-containing protein n=1 Tax=Clostridium sp. VAP23 TaxID=2949981 RepID=UPI00207A550A|nr:helix-turn-helix transcriptional regulator [Clostridium sp. VAP23]